jgi:hypothetical protein
MLYREVNAVLNTRPREALGFQDSTTVWEAGWAERKGTATAADVIVLNNVRAFQKKRANQRRGPGAPAARAFAVGDHVRENDDEYRKATLRGNAEKMAYKGSGAVAGGLPGQWRSGTRAWKRDVKEITSVRVGKDGSAPAYSLNHAARQPNGKWTEHEHVARTYAAVPEAPPVAVARAGKVLDLPVQIMNNGTVNRPQTQAQLAPPGAYQRQYYRGYAMPE